MGRILLTGASGWIGSHCIEPLLERDYEVHGLRRDRGWADPRVQWHSCDLLSAADRRRVIERVRPSHLLHLAWNVQPGYRTAACNWDWLAASVDLFAQFAKAGGTRIVGAGTCLEYDWASGICRESDAASQPTTPYGRAKLALAHTLGAANISTAWGRIFFLFGPGEARGRLIPSVVTSLLVGRKAECSEGTQVRDFLYVRDLGRAFAALVDSEARGPVDLASGRPLAIRDLVRAFADQLGMPEQVALGVRRVSGDDAQPRLLADVSRTPVGNRRRGEVVAQSGDR